MGGGGNVSADDFFGVSFDFGRWSLEQKQPPHTT
jgi:hypothetical protein